MKRIVVIGGGTGTYVVLSGLKKYDFDLSAIVTMMDSGGSTGRLRDQLGVLPPGDVRQCLVALSEAPELWRELFIYRFGSGDLKGHNFGNIFLSALEKTTNDYQDVIDTASFILKTKGQVIPVTFDSVQLCAQYSDGEVICSEKFIDTASHKKERIKKLYVDPEASPNKKAIEAISSADYILIGPGDLYTSLIPNLVVEGVAEEIVKSTAKIILVVNLMTKQGQTTDYTALDHVQDLEQYLGREADAVLINQSPIAENIVAYYKSHNEIEVKDDLGQGKKIFRAPIVTTSVYTKSKDDLIFRSILRHDPQKLAELIDRIIKRI